MNDDLKGKTQKELVLEFVKRMHTLELDEITIKEAKKDLKDEFKDFIDLKTLNQAWRILKIKDNVKNKDTFDFIVELLEKEGLV